MHTNLSSYVKESFDKNQGILIVLYHPDDMEVLVTDLRKWGYNCYDNNIDLYEEVDYPIVLKFDNPLSKGMFDLYALDFIEDMEEEEEMQLNIYYGTDFFYKDTDMVDHIMKKGIISPNYSSRKITRTLEAVTIGKYYNEIEKIYSEYPYRFKTEEELRAEYGYYWEDSAFPTTGWNSDMNHLLGEDFPYITSLLDMDTMNNNPDEKRTPLYNRDLMVDEFGNRWYICWDMLTKNKLNGPNYNPRKITRTLEKFENKYKYGMIVVKVDNHEDSKKIQELCIKNEKYY